MSADQFGRVRTLALVVERTVDMSAAHTGPRLLRHHLLHRSIFGVELVNSPAS